MCNEVTQRMCENMTATKGIARASLVWLEDHSDATVIRYFAGKLSCGLEINPIFLYLSRITKDFGENVQNERYTVKYQCEYKSADSQPVLSAENTMGDPRSRHDAPEKAIRKN